MSADAVVFSVEAAVAQIDAWVSPHLRIPCNLLAFQRTNKSALLLFADLGLTTSQSTTL